MDYKKINNSFKVFTISVFLILLLPQMFQEGLFMDGLIYSSISNNLSKGEGSFWFPKFSETVLTNFHEHPPLQFGVQSLIFKIFGNDFYVEKIYSGFTGLLTALLIILIWKKINKGNRYTEMYWLPVLFWVTIPRVFWSYNNNMLENTMGLFSLAAVYILLLAIGKIYWKRILYFIAVSILLCLSFLSKGFPGLYPLGFFFCYYIAYSKSFGFKSMITNSFLLLLTLISISVIYLILNHKALESISNYLHTQVLASIEGKGRVGSRFALLYDLLQQILIMMIICATLILLNLKNFIKVIKQNKGIFHILLLFFLIGLSASLPLMISPKLSAFYLVPSLPFFAIFFALMISDIVNTYMGRINHRSLKFKFLDYFSYLLIVSVATYSIINYGNTCRDKELIADINKIGNILPVKSTISVQQSFYSRWSLMGYFQRKFQINIDRSGRQNEYLLIEKTEPEIDGYEDTELQLLKFKLLKHIR